MKKLLSITLAIIMLLTLGLTACNNADNTPETSGNTTATDTEGTSAVTTTGTENSTESTTEKLPGGDTSNVDGNLDVNVMVLNGTTGFGMARLMDNNEKGLSFLNYNFSVESDASNITAALLNGTADIAALPTNAAANLFNKKGSVQMLAVNTLGVLSIMTGEGVTVNSFADLEGKTVYTISNGTPAAILKYLLAESGVNATVKTAVGEGENAKELTSPNDLASQLIAGNVDIALVPEPVATAVPLKITSQNKDYNYSVAIDLTDAWGDVSTSPVAMGCIVASKDFVNNHKGLVDSFLAEYESSINFVANPENLELAAQYVVDAGVLDALPAAKKSITNLGSAIAYYDGARMKTTLVAFYNAIGLNLIGGRLPDDEFYYEK